MCSLLRCRSRQAAVSRTFIRLTIAEQCCEAQVLLPCSRVEAQHEPAANLLRASETGLPANRVAQAHACSGHFSQRQGNCRNA